MATPSIPGRRGRSAPPPGTLVLFVRHGRTPTTGQVLPGRAPGLHLAEDGRAQAEAVAERLASWAGPPAGDGPSDGGSAPRAPAGSSNPRNAHNPHNPRNPHDPHNPHDPRRPTITAVYASPLERTRETAAPIARRFGLKITVDRGLVDCDFGEWTGEELKKLAKLPEWTTVQRYPSGFRFPGGESFEGMRARMSDAVSALCHRHPGETIVAVSHADPIKVTVSDALGAPLDLFQRIMISPCSVSAISYHATGPVVLAVNSTGCLTEVPRS
jgi:broad specificity phosphatase PhoE